MVNIILSECQNKCFCANGRKPVLLVFKKSILFKGTADGSCITKVKRRIAPEKAAFHTVKKSQCITYLIMIGENKRH